MEIFMDEKQLSCATLLYKILQQNDGNIDDPIFISTLKKVNANLNTLSILDYYIHDEIDDIDDNYDIDDNITFKLKSDYGNVKINDIIGGKKVIGVFTFTIWLNKKN